MRFVVAVFSFCLIAAPSLAQDSLTYRLEAFLAELGHNPGTIDGQIDDATHAAIRAYQSARGYPVSGGVTMAEFQQLEQDILAHRGIAATPQPFVPAATPSSTGVPRYMIEGPHNCQGVKTLDPDACVELIYALARHVRCPAVTPGSSMDCIRRKAGIGSGGYASNRNKVWSLFRDFREGQANPDKDPNVLTRIGGQANWEWYSNFYGARVTCPDPGVIEMRVTSGEPRDMTRDALFEILRVPARRTQREAWGTNLCLDKPVRMLVRADGQVVYDKMTGPDIREPGWRTTEFMEDTALLLYAAFNPPEPFGPYMNGELFAKIAAGQYRAREEDWVIQVRVKNFFVVYHNVYHKLCLQPDAPEGDLDWRLAQIEAALWGAEIIRTRTSTDRRTGEVTEEESWKTIDIQPGFGELYVSITNADTLPALNSRFAGAESRSPSGRLARDARRLIANLGCGGDTIDEFEQALAGAAAQSIVTR